MGAFYDTLAKIQQDLAARQAMPQVPAQTPTVARLASSLSNPAAVGTPAAADPFAAPTGGVPAMPPPGTSTYGGEGIGPVSGDLMTRNGVTMVEPALMSLIQAKRELGIPVLGNVVSDYRTTEEQARLYDLYKRGLGNLAAPPGRSNHETGNAVDISSAFLQQNPQLVQYLLSKGWTNDVPGEPWHWEYGV